jgi:hypothetical protein
MIIFEHFRFGVDNISGFISDDEASDSDSDSSDSGGRAIRRKRGQYSPTDYKNKDDTAEDFFDITELADEAAAGSKQPADDYDDIEEAIPAVKVTAEGTVKMDTMTRNLCRRLLKMQHRQLSKRTLILLLPLILKVMYRVCHYLALF